MNIYSKPFVQVNWNAVIPNNFPLVIKTCGMIFAISQSVIPHTNHVAYVEKDNSISYYERKNNDWFLNKDPNRLANKYDVVRVA
jgi:hypothetical protein